MKINTRERFIYEAAQEPPIWQDDRNLELDRLQLTDADAPLVADIILNCRNLDYLDIGYNEFSDEGARIIADALGKTENPRLNWLGFSGNDAASGGKGTISEDGYRAIADSGNRNICFFGVVQNRDLSNLCKKNKERSVKLGTDLENSPREEWGCREIAGLVALEGALNMSATDIPAFSTQELLDEWNNQRSTLPTVATLPSITLDTLRQHDADGTSPLHHPDTWARMPEIAPLLAENGTPMDKAALFLPFRNGEPPILSGIYAYQLPTVMDLLAAEGEQLTPDNLLDSATNMPNPILQAICGTDQAAALFTEANWRGQPPTALQKTLRALPEEARAQVKNAHALLTLLSRDAQGAQQGRG